MNGILTMLFSKEELIYLREAIALISYKYEMDPIIRKNLDNLWLTIELIMDQSDKEKCNHEWGFRLFSPFRRFIPKRILNSIINYIEKHVFCHLCGDKYDNR